MSFLIADQEIRDLIHQVQTALPEKTKAYLVGGAVRDLISGREIHDLDFTLVTNSKVTPIARRIANQISASFYPLDKERDTARLIFTSDTRKRLFLDFSALRDTGLEEDLTGRDFTINAMAIDLEIPDQLIDPLEGTKDIQQKILKACSETSFLSDPLRILRAVRLAVQFDYRITSDTLKLLRQALPQLQQVSPERLRDEIFRLLSIKNLDTSLRILEKLEILPLIFPEISNLIEVQQSSPHVMDVWRHTLSVVQKLEQILFVLGPDSNLEESGNIVSSWISLRLGRYRPQIADHFLSTLNPERSLQSLLFMAAIYHDAGKASTQSINSHNAIHFYGHEQTGRDQLIERARFLRLSNQEIDRLGAIVNGHMRPFLLNRASEIPSRRAIYKFWRDLGEAGVDVCLLSIADLMGTYGSSLPNEVLTSHLTTVRSLLDAWWEQRQELVAPPFLLNGNQLMQELNLKPGPVVGRLLEAIRQGQVEGTVTNLQQALDYSRKWLASRQTDL